MDGAIKRLLGMVEAGLMEVDDPALRERLSVLKTKRKALTAQLERASDLQPANRPHLTEAKLHRLSETVRTALHTAPPEMRKAYIKLFVDKVVVSKQAVELTGPKSLLARAALTTCPIPRNRLLLMFGNGVPKGIRTPVTAVKGRCPRPLDDGD